MTRALPLIFCSAFLAGCGSGADSEQNITIDDAAPSAEGRSDLISASGEAIGTVTYLEEGSGVQLRVEVSGLEPGTHAVHLHETGSCETPDFQSAGGHWNPMGKEHGRDNPNGAHLGDLANMEVGDDGTGSASYMVTGVSYAGGEPSMIDADGTALMIHEGADDYVTDPTGDAGGRVACAVLAGAA